MGIFPGVRLHIFAKDVDQVRGILGNYSDEDFIKCPYCNSLQLEKNYSAWSKILGSAKLLIGVLLPAARNQYHCNTCGKSFDELD
jgi:DNA-directed RNA polymerase subunit RPC12/RpoP